MPSSRLWPYRTMWALLASVLILALALGGLVGLREAGALGDRVDRWLLLGAVLFALVPVFLAVLDRAGRVKGPAGLEIWFETVENTARIDLARTTIAGNLGGVPGAAVFDSLGSTILQTLRPVLGTEVAVVDLREGQEWWQTRLLLLTAGAVRLGQPRVLVFTATVSGKPGRFLAWATPRELLRAHLRNAHPRLQHAYRTAEALSARWTIGLPQDNAVNQVVMPWNTPGATAPATMSTPGPVHADLIPEQFLLQSLISCEQPGDAAIPDLGVTVAVLQSLFTAVLRDDSLEREADDVTWRDAILAGTDDYIAVTERGAYVSMVSRQAAINALLRSLAAPVGVDRATH